MAKKKIMRRFDADEISLVDEPAQEHARVKMFKRFVPADPDAKELAAFEKWLAKGAFSIGDPEASTVTLLLDGEERTFFAKGDDDDESISKNKPVTEEDLDPDAVAAVLAALGKKNKEIEAGIAELKKENDVSKPVNKQVETKRPEDFSKTVNAIRARDGCSGTVAMQKARTEDPAAFAIYQHAPNFAGIDIAKRQEDKARVTKGNDFLAKAEAIRKRDNCSPMMAMQKARVEHRKEFEAWQQA